MQITQNYFLFFLLLLIFLGPLPCPWDLLTILQKYDWDHALDPKEPRLSQNSWQSSINIDDFESRELYWLMLPIILGK